MKPKIRGKSRAAALADLLDPPLGMGRTGPPGPRGPGLAPLMAGRASRRHRRARQLRGITGLEGAGLLMVALLSAKPSTTTTKAWRP